MKIPPRIEKYQAETLGQPLLRWPAVPKEILDDILHVLETFPTTGGLALEPHPERFVRSGYAFLMRALIANEWDAFAHLLTSTPSPALALHDLHTLPETQRVVRSIAQAGRMQGHAANAGAGIIPILALYYIAQKGTLVHATDALHHLMRLSELSGLPVELLRLPFPAIFLEFGSRNAPDPLWLHGTDGDYRIEGMYLFEHLHPAGPLAKLADSVSLSQARFVPGVDTEPVREITTVVSGSPAGKTRIDDDYLFVFTLYLPESRWSMPVEDAVEEQFECYEQCRRQVGGDVIEKQFFQDLRDAILHAAKILFYMGSHEARIERAFQREALLEEAQRRKGGKRRKTLARAARASNRILVGPESHPVLEETRPPGSGRTVRPHWRRGHWHTVRYGPGRTKRRLDYFPPVLVRADAIEGEPEKQRYEVD